MHKIGFYGYSLNIVKCASLSVVASMLLSEKVTETFLLSQQKDKKYQFSVLLFNI